MRIRFQADADLKQAIVFALVRREPQIDFQTATVVDLEGIDDANVLAIAANDGRALGSHDKRTIPKHFAAFIATQTSSGVITLRQRMPIAHVIEELLLIRHAPTPDEWTNRIAHLPV